MLVELNQWNNATTSGTFISMFCWHLRSTMQIYFEQVLELLETHVTLRSFEALRCGKNSSKASFYCKKFSCWSVATKFKETVLFIEIIVDETFRRSGYQVAGVNWLLKVRLANQKEDSQFFAQSVKIIKKLFR